MRRLRVRAASLVLLVACGRLGFDTVDAPTGASIDGRISYRAIVLSDAPIAYWRLGDSGTLARDELGMFDGTYIGACARGTAGALFGDPDPAVTFDGSSCEIELPAAFGFAGVAPFSIEAWIRGELPTSFHHIFTYETRGPQLPIDGYALVVQDNGFQFERIVSMGNASTFPIPFESSWHHVVAEFDGAAVRVYFDGLLSRSSVDTRQLNNAQTNALIGASVNGNFFAGSIDEVAVYGTALEPDRVLAHYVAGAKP